MKGYVCVVTALGLACGYASPSPNTYASVTNDWYNSNFTNVYQLAQQRQSVNTNDVVAAYLLLEWQSAFGSVSDVSNAVSRTITLSDNVTNQPFRAFYQKIRPMTLVYRDVVLPRISDSEVEAERHKSFLPNKIMIEDVVLKSLWDSGLW